MSQRPFPFVAACAFTLCLLSAPCTTPLDAAEATTAHQHHEHPKGETATSTDKHEPPPDFISKGETATSVKLTIIATYDETNHGMNFNGFSHGKALYTIPLGWTVDVDFINRSAVPHSAVVVEDYKTSKMQVGKPYFAEAATKDYDKATAEKSGHFSFVADEAGDFAIACGFPIHAANGHWMALKISKEAKQASLTLPDGTKVVVK
ncbi:MAG: hypothetical protein ACI9X0_000691 [Kiritimatiellia bacterium]|jgi:hypothetical protein